MFNRDTRPTFITRVRSYVNRQSTWPKKFLLTDLADVFSFPECLYFEGWVYNLALLSKC